MQTKVIYVPASYDRNLSIRIQLIRSLPKLTKVIESLKRKLKKKTIPPAEKITLQKTISFHQAEKMKVLDALSIPDAIFNVPATKKQLKQLERENPQKYKEYTQQNIQENI